MGDVRGIEDNDSRRRLLPSVSQMGNCIHYNHLSDKLIILAWLERDGNKKCLKGLI